MPKVALGFAGCKVNSYEIQALSEAMESLGMEIVSFNDRADCYIINTCSVTSKADMSSRNLVRRAKRIAPGAKIAVTGCYSELNPGEISGIGIDLLIPNSEKEQIPGKIVDLLGVESDKADLSLPREFGSFTISRMRGLTRGFVKIQEGCDRKCTYCTIWKSRGNIRSRNPRFVIDEINKLYQNGYLEIVLTGVHIGNYRFGDLDLVGLLSLILNDSDIPRIRLSSMHPSEIDDRFIEILSGNRICPHVHLSVQSGDDTILRDMGRDYTRSDLERIIDSLNRTIPGITVGADIIAGFPGEADLQFKNSYDLIANFGIHHLHVFPFSARPGTIAAEMGNRIDAGIINKRTEELRKLGQQKIAGHMKKFINKELQVLIENRADYNGDELTGLSENYLRVNIQGKSDYKGKIVRVRPYALRNSALTAHVIRE